MGILDKIRKSGEGISEVKTYLCQGTNNVATSVDKIKSKITEFFNIKNVNFLFGAGTSAVAIPSMKDMEKEISEKITDDKEIKALYDSVKKDNLENTLTVLYAKKFYMENTGNCGTEYKCAEKLISRIEKTMYEKINIDWDKEVAQKNIELYKEFYQKIALRNKDLSRLHVFTTNNDLFNEKALDLLEINYNNGFSCGLERVFNPARFYYTFSKKIDMNLEKYEPLENMVYLYKLHGSISWVNEQRKGNPFGIYEIPIKSGDPERANHVMIYPTPLKHEYSLGAPYSDLIREFQTRLSLSNSVLFIIGYSFSDQHLNNVISRSLLSNTTLTIVIFGSNNKSAIAQIGDNRIFRIYGTDDTEKENEKIHYFDYIVKKLLPVIDYNTDRQLLNAYKLQLEEVTKANEQKTQ